MVEHVNTDEARINQLAGQCDEHACSMLAWQSPVARELRTIVTAIKAAERIERMGDLVKHVAAIARLRHPESAVPPQLADQFADMARCRGRQTSATVHRRAQWGRLGRFGPRR